MIKFLPYAGWPLAIVLFFLWLDGKENLASEIERCNTDKMAAIAEASNAARQALAASMERRIRELENMASAEREARLIADAARIEAESRPPVTRTIIREIANDDPENCLNQLIPERLVDSLR